MHPHLINIMAPFRAKRQAETGLWSEGKIENAQRHLDYLLFTPVWLARKPALIVLLHGCRQTAAEFAHATDMARLAALHGFLLCLPQQNLTANPLRCWNWFDPRNQDTAGEAGLIMKVRDELATEHGIAPSRVFVAGLSAGGSMAAILGRAFPQQIGAIGVHSGVPTGAATTIIGAMHAMETGDAGDKGPGPMRTIVFHGLDDDVVASANGDRIAFAQALGRGRRFRIRQRSCRRFVIRPNGDHAAAEYWRVEELGHAWSGGQHGGSYADPLGPRASREMLRFFLGYPRWRYPIVYAWLAFLSIFR
ncbi:PHB depolymerase family esterase [Cognatiyoonia sp. IB215446]|uniref:extracellular catalytic domain type 1 short-chain-length polyhydroxyalkanoate depolymerase n=1 Tax=Cognatiyoonia sp. IB215446 TaxID=3097355 RepID=UPI002A10F6F9|nr:PHB depolymerase family esterase [Cognatiyoonia sp. IB215446]MDX8346440.1 PHB depolymerase family esterase [Cognatiyoonia sp. IB215446]